MSQPDRLIDKTTEDAFTQLALTADRFERYEHPHASRVAIIADAIATIFHMARHDRGSLRAAALLHDLGETMMERDYIQRAGSLTDEERSDLWRHPLIGEREASRVGADRATQLLVRWHHEWWNGRGYPDALRRDEIPLAARILRVADSYSALTDSRPYRPALTADAARQKMTDLAGIEFDPAVVKVFLYLDANPELNSYARPDDQLLPAGKPASKGLDLFSSFMR